MNIEHIAIWTADLESMKSFYMRFFDARPGEKYQNPAKGFTSYFLSFDGGARLELMHGSSIQESARKNAEHRGLAHLAFRAGGKENVDTLTETIRKAGYEIVSEPRITGDGYYESCVLDPEGNRIEIVG
jgi:lactoylglutathione lyase